MSNKSQSQQSQPQFTDEEVATIEELIQKYIDEHPNDDYSDTNTRNLVRKSITDATGHKNFKLMSISNELISKLAPNSDGKSSNKSTVKRVITEDPSASASEARKDDNDDDENDDDDDSKSKSKSKSTTSKSSSTKASSTKSSTTKSSTSKSSDSEKRTLPKKPQKEDTGKKTISTSTKGTKAPPANGVVTHANKITKNTTIVMPGMPYNADADLDVCDFEDDKPFFEVFEQLIALISANSKDIKPKEIIAQTKTYIKALQKLHNDFVLPAEVKGTGAKPKKNTKVQQFKFTHTGKEKTPVVKYVDTKELKSAIMDENDAKPIIDYQLAIEKVAKKLPKFVTGSNGKVGGEGFPWLDLLCSDFVLTPNIIATTALKKLAPSGDEKLFKPLGFFLEDISIEDILLNGSEETTDDLDYVMLFNDIRRIPTSKIGMVAKNVFTHRRGAIKQLDSDVRKTLWFQALNNINSLSDEVIDQHQEEVEEDYRNKFVTADDKQIIHTWQKLLSSKYVYAVVMNGIAPNKFFEKAFMRFISHSTSVRLFMTALYPIAFLFTPFHCYIDKAVDAKTFTDIVTPVTFNKRIKEVIAKLITANAINADTNTWCYYTNNVKDTNNHILRLLTSYVNGSSSTSVNDDLEEDAPAKDDNLVTDDDNADGEDND